VCDCDEGTLGDRRGVVCTVGMSSLFLAGVLAKLKGISVSSFGTGKINTIR